MSEPDPLEAVFALRQRFWANGYRPLEVWNPDQLTTDKGDPLNSPGKQPRGRWRKDASQDPPEAVHTYPDPRALNTGLLCGDISAFDVDVLDQELADRVVHMIESTLGPTPLTRIGRAPKILLVYRSECRFTKLQTPELFFTDGTKAKVEVLADGQQFVADGIHPDTGQPYYWTSAGVPESVPLAELPIVTEEQARAIITEAERLLREAGGKEKEKPHQERAKPNGAAGDFFSQVNTAALADIARWVRALFPRARFEPGTGAWRVSSKDLGRTLEEDISIHPSGIRDFGEETAQSPIDLVIRYGGAADALQAALWLCDRLGVDPAALGYVAPQARNHDAEKPTWQKPTIKVTAGERHLAADQGLRALAGSKVPFYQRNRKIQRIALVQAKNTSGEIIEVPGIVSVDPAMMERELGRSAIWQRYDMRQKKLVRIDPPSGVSSQILSMVGQWPFAPLTGIIQCPTLRRDGTLLDLPGYDEASGLVLVGNITIPPIRPTREDAARAIDLMRTLLAEFPFVDKESEAVALSMIITPVVRGAMTVAPMHLITAPLPGTGKSYLADCASMIATGERCAVKSAAPSYEETEKRLIGSALAGFPIIALDNCRDGIAGDFFCQIVERPLMELRALGKSDQHRIPNTFTMFANGNNAGVAEDMVRRTIRSGLDANLENPETRTFQGNPLATIQRNRGKYIAAALTIPLAHMAAGSPSAQPPLISFEDWSRVIRDFLIWLGCGDPVATQAKLRTDDPRKAEKSLILETWKLDIGVGHERRCSTKEVIAAADIREKLKDALLAVAAARFSAERKIDPKALGKWLSAHEGTIAASCKLTADRTNAAVPRWYVDLQ